jgi:hypothetical protein
MEGQVVILDLGISILFFIIAYWLAKWAASKFVFKTA